MNENNQEKMRSIPPLALTADDSEFLRDMEKARLSIEEVCRIYAIPPHLLKDGPPK